MRILVRMKPTQMVRRAETLANAMRNVEMILVNDEVLATLNGSLEEYSIHWSCAENH